MNFSTTAVIIAAVAACNGRDPHAVQAARVPAVALDAAPMAIPPAATRDAPAAGAEDAAARVDGPADGPADGSDDLPAAPEVEAFHGQVPALPMLSPDGKLVAIDVSEGLGLSSFHSYEVAFVEAGGRVRERIAVVDRALAAALASDAARAAGRPAIQLPTRRLAVAAARITARLAGFTPFARELDHDAIGRADGELALGGAALAFHGHPTAGLELRLIGAGGAMLRRERIAVRPPQYTDREGGRCGGQPRLAGVWWDPPRRRALLLVIFPGRDLCEDEPALWLVW
jgi:hypothetical protein